MPRRRGPTTSTGRSAEARQAIAVAEEVDAKPILAGGHFITGHVHAVTGRLDQAEEEIDQALTISRAGGDVFHQSFALTCCRTTQELARGVRRGVAPPSRGLRIARDHNLLVPLLFSFFDAGWP